MADGWVYDDAPGAQPVCFAAVDDAASILCRIMLQGLASQPPSDDELDRSNAIAAAKDAITSWTDDSALEANDKAGRVRAVSTSAIRPQGI